MTTMPMERNPFGVGPAIPGGPQVGMTLPPAIQQQMRIDPRLLQALQARQAGADTSPVYTPLQGLARALQGAVGGWQQRKLMEEYQGQADQYRTASTDMIEALTGGDYARAGEIASSNPYLADMATKIAMSGAQSRSAAETQRAKQEFEAEQKRLDRDARIQAAEISAGGKAPNNYMLPGGQNVLSYDNRSYVDPQTGQQAPLPPNAIRISSTTAFDNVQSARVAADARSALEGTPAEQAPMAGTQGGPTLESAARAGTGPWASIAAGIDAVAGGLGVDKAFGREGLFPQTQENRTYLRNLAQIGKSALVNNPRFPVAEQQLVANLLPNPDRFWANPSTEAQKAVQLRQTLGEMKTQNLRSLAAGNLPAKNRDELVAKNAEIDRVLGLMGGGAPSADQIPDGAIVIQDGRRYRKQGNDWVEVR